MQPLNVQMCRDGYLTFVFIFVRNMTTPLFNNKMGSFVWHIFSVLQAVVNLHKGEEIFWDYPFPMFKIADSVFSVSHFCLPEVLLARTVHCTSYRLKYNAPPPFPRLMIFLDTCYPFVRLHMYIIFCNLARPEFAEFPWFTVPVIGVMSVQNLVPRRRVWL